MKKADVPLAALLHEQIKDAKNTRIIAWVEQRRVSQFILQAIKDSSTGLDAFIDKHQANPELLLARLMLAFQDATEKEVINSDDLKEARALINAIKALAGKSIETLAKEVVGFFKAQDSLSSAHPLLVMTAAVLDGADERKQRTIRYHMRCELFDECNKRVTDYFKASKKYSEKGEKQFTLRGYSAYGF